MDERFLTCTGLPATSDYSWGGFVLQWRLFLKNSPLPSSFPLRKALRTWVPDQFILMDYERWNPSGQSSAP